MHAGERFPVEAALSEQGTPWRRWQQRAGRWTLFDARRRFQGLKMRSRSIAALTGFASFRLPKIG